MERPLIVTLALDAASQAFFNDLRQAHFPPERNYLDAHLTLFHALPPTERQTISGDLLATADQTPPLVLEVTGLQSLGKGTAFRIECPALKAMHRCLQQAWKPWLTPQDQQGLHPHVTVQNKVTPTAAKALQAALEADFKPFQATGTGLLLWEYLGGPWELVQEIPFTAASAATDSPAHSRPR